MLQGEEELHGRFKVALLIVACILLSSCATTSNGQSKRGGSQNSPTINLEYVKESEVTFKAESAEKLLAGSIEIPNLGKDGYAFLPTKFYKNKIFGFISKVGVFNDVEFAYIDLDTNEYVSVKKAEGNKEFATIFCLASNDKYVLFFENNQEADVGEGKIYLYDYASKELTTVHTIPKYHPLFHMSAVFVEDDIYFNSLEDFETENIEEISAMYKYNIYSKKKEKIRKNTSFITKTENDIYFMAMDNISTSLMSYNLDSKKEQLLFKGNNKVENLLNYVVTKDEIIFLTQKAANPTMNEFTSYRYNIEGKRLNLFLDEQYMGALKEVDNHLISWLDVGDGTPRGTTYLYDLRDKINYNYNQGEIIFSEDAIVWTRYNKDPATIPKGEVYANENSTLMYKKVE